MGKQTILVIGDLHAPYMHRDASAFLKAVKAKYRPDKVVLMGDELDFHALSYHEHNPDLASAGAELIAGKKQLSSIFKLFPEADVLESNHGSMVYRKALTAGIPSAVLKGYREISGAPKGWKWHVDLTLDTPLGPVYFHHGKSSTAEKLSKSMAMSCIQGHFHTKFYVSYWASPRGLYFDANAGCLIDKDSMSFAYDKNNIPRPMLGVIVIIDGVAVMVPMILAKGGRWIGHL